MDDTTDVLIEHSGLIRGSKDSFPSGCRKGAGILVYFSESFFFLPFVILSQVSVAVNVTPIFMTTDPS